MTAANAGSARRDASRAAGATGVSRRRGAWVAKKRVAAALVKQAGLPLTLNAVVHRQNLHHLPELVALVAMHAVRGSLFRILEFSPDKLDDPALPELLLGLVVGLGLELLGHRCSSGSEGRTSDSSASGWSL